MAGTGLYIHLPYCTSICPYCDFNAYATPKHGPAPYPALQAAMLKELATRAPLFTGPLDAVYFGGGTPSLAPPSLIAAMLHGAREHLGLRPGAEVTLEANPGTLDASGLAAFRAAGINRLSMGWQSTHNNLLRVLGRDHSASDSHEAFVQARAAGFDVISLDLIFAVPGQTQVQLQADLATIAQLQPEHVSLYAMTIKAGTPFARRQARGTLTPADEAVEVAMMAQINQALERAGYEHYEVSNYAKPGRRAVHNSLYWQGGEYLGVGPGAHSFHHDNWQQGWRWEGVRRPEAYIAAWSEWVASASVWPLPTHKETDTTVSFSEELTAHQLFSERMMCGLRHVDGVDLSNISVTKKGNEMRLAIRGAQKYLWAEYKSGIIRPTNLGLQNADALASMFF